MTTRAPYEHLLAASMQTGAVQEVDHPSPGFTQSNAISNRSSLVSILSIATAADGSCWRCIVESPSAPPDDDDDNNVTVVAISCGNIQAEVCPTLTQY